MKRGIIKINEELCNGCGLCVPNCHEGALAVIDGKLRLVSELMCDGLGACIGHCPEGAITIESREAEPYDETGVMEQMKDKGRNTIAAHLIHLKEHGETGYLKEGVKWLKEHRDEISFNLEDLLSEVHNQDREKGTPNNEHGGCHGHVHREGACPGSQERELRRPERSDTGSADHPSELTHWPVQMHLLNPSAANFRETDLLLSADCVAFSTGNFHSRYLRGKSLAIACPKLDHGTDIYIGKLTALIETAKVNTITVMMMEVPCCGGLMQIVKAAQANTSRKVPVKQLIVSISGSILKEEWV